MTTTVLGPDVACPYCVNPNEKELPLTREFLDEMHCPDPDCTCTTIGFRPNCHPDAGYHSYYCKKHGTLALFCVSCGWLKSAIEIAKEHTYAGR